MIHNLKFKIDETHTLSLTQDIDPATGYAEHKLVLMRYVPDCRGYVLMGETIEVYEVHDLFDIIRAAYEGNLDIFLKVIDVEFDIDNDNEPMLSLIIDNDSDWPEDRADD